MAAPIVIGKSLGSLAAPVAASRGRPAVWLTPVLTETPTVAALRRAAAHAVPGRLSESATVLGQVITTVENFLDQQVWP